jgi:hypothetical protein
MFELFFHAATPLITVIVIIIKEPKAIQSSIFLFLSQWSEKCVLINKKKFTRKN